MSVIHDMFGEKLLVSAISTDKCLNITQRMGFHACAQGVERKEADWLPQRLRMDTEDIGLVHFSGEAPLREGEKSCAQGIKLYYLSIKRIMIFTYMALL